MVLTSSRFNCPPPWHGLPAHAIVYDKHGQDARATNNCRTAACRHELFNITLFGIFASQKQKNRLSKSPISPLLTGRTNINKAQRGKETKAQRRNPPSADPLRFGYKPVSQCSVNICKSRVSITLSGYRSQGGFQLASAGVDCQALAKAAKSANSMP